MIPNLFSLGFFRNMALTSGAKATLLITNIVMSPFMKVFANWAWLYKKNNSDLWHLHVKSEINYGILQSSCRIIFTVFMYAYGIIPAPWSSDTFLKFTDANENKICLLYTSPSPRDS